MEEKKELKSKLLIFKHPGYRDMKCVLGIDPKREKDFNQMKKVEVTKDELLKIGVHRWLLNI